MSTRHVGNREQQKIRNTNGKKHIYMNIQAINMHGKTRKNQDMDTEGNQ